MVDDEGDPLDVEGDDDAPLEGGGEEEVGASELVEDSELVEAADEQKGEALAAVKQQSGASQRIQQEIARRKKLETENEEYRRHILDIQRRDAVSKPITEDPEEERRRLEFMDEGQRVQYLVDKGVRSYQTDVRRLELQMNINSDKIGFSSFITANPQFKKYADDVEVEFNQALKSGNPRGRSEILTSLVGSEVIKRGSTALTKAKQTGADNLRRQQTRPAAIRSGVTGTSGRKESAEETLKRRLSGGEYS